MKNYKYKYSIIVPVYNGGEYLLACVESIIKQNYSNYELIISNDQSNDNTSEYLSTLNHPNIIILTPPEGLSMTEHWEWALSHANGEWQMFVGQDDGLQSYFFELADILTKFAKNKNTKLIMTERAYYFWPGCEFVYGDIAVAYRAINKIFLKNCNFEALKALMGIQEYFELPQMYTTSLFHSDLINQAKLKQNGKLLLTHPQDANLAAIACSLEKKYVKSKIPFGWVGSSPKSAGMAVTSDSKEGPNQTSIKNLKTEYINKIKTSKLRYSYLAGEFEFGNLSLYLWQSFLQTPDLRSNFFNKFLTSNFFKTIFFSQILNEIKQKKVTSSSLNDFKRILILNGCRYGQIQFISLFTGLFTNVLKKIFIYKNKFTDKFYSQVNYTQFWKTSPYINLINASNEIDQLVNQKGWLKKYKKSE